MKLSLNIIVHIIMLIVLLITITFQDRKFTITPVRRRLNLFSSPKNITHHYKNVLRYWIHQSSFQKSECSSRMTYNKIDGRLHDTV